MTMDFMPTLIEVAGIQYSGQMDGKSFLQEVLHTNQEEFTKRKQFYTWLQGYKKHALRIDDWKLVKDSQKHKYELYNLKTDISENKNLIKTNPEKASELANQLAKALKSHGVKWSDL